MPEKRVYLRQSGRDTQMELSEDEMDELERRGASFNRTRGGKVYLELP